MKIGIVSDIHCNLAGLERALALMGGVNELICAGDAIYQYRFSNDVVRLLRERNAWTIQGNHEETFFQHNLARARQDATIEQDLLEWLASRPLTLRLRLDGRAILVVHGSPWEPRKRVPLSRQRVAQPLSGLRRRCGDLRSHPSPTRPAVRRRPGD